MVTRIGPAGLDRVAAGPVGFRGDGEVGGHVSLTIPGVPVPWARARRNGGRYFKASEVVEFESRAQTAWMVAGRPAFPPGTPLTVCAYFHFPRPASHLKANGELRKGAPGFVQRVDVDNLQKNVGDALNGLLWPDDAQIVCWAAAAKRYCEGGEEPRVELQVWPAAK